MNNRKATDTKFCLDDIDLSKIFNSPNVFEMLPDQLILQM